MRRGRRAACAGIALAVLSGGAASAQSLTAPPVPSQDIFGLGQLLFNADATRNAPSDRLPTRPGANAIPVGDWLVYPTADLGAFYDDNLYASRFNRVSDYGVRFRPSAVLTHSDGIHDTLVYGSGDARAFANNSRVDTVQGTIGATHRYEITRDLVMRFQGEYDHRADDYGQALLSDSLRGALIPPVQYDQIYLSSSIRQDFGDMFAGIGTSYQSTRYDSPKDSFGVKYDQTFRNEDDVRLIGRVGYKISPALYAFVEPSIIWQQFKSQEFNSTGHRVVAGLGSDRMSLFSGEIFAGYQDVGFDDRQIRSADGAVFGGRLTWLPTRDITVSTFVERSLGLSGLSSSFNRLNTSTGLEPSFQSNVLNPLQQTVSRTTSVGAQGTYAATRELSAEVGGGYQVSNYANTSLELISAQLGLKYLLLRNLGLKLDYSYARATSGDPLFTRNRVTLGMFGQL